MLKRIFNRKFCMKTFGEHNVPIFKVNLSTDIEVARRQVAWRVRNMGQLEFELIFLKWFESNREHMDLKDLQDFATECLEMENPELNRYFVNMIKAPEDLKYTNIIQKSLI